MMNLLTPEALTALVSVIGIDLVLAGDNAIVIGMAAAGLEKTQRIRAIILGILASTVLRIAFALMATKMLAITGLTLAGGILLLWVCWKMWTELREDNHIDDSLEVLSETDNNHDGQIGAKAKSKTFLQAAWQIVVADISMSLDNVLAVAGAAKEHPEVLVFGLGLSIAMMGLAASAIAGLLNKYRWIAYAGLAIIVYVAVHMTYEGVFQVLPLILQGN